MRPTSAALRLQVESALAGRVASPFRLRDTAPSAMVPVGIPALDESTGGLPRGSLTEIYGPISSGKTSLLLSAFAGRTASAEVCALVDAQDAFDPNSAKAAGVNLQRLLWVRCQTLDQALRSTDLLLHGGGFGLVALDLGDVPARLVRQIPLNAWFRLRRSVEGTPTILMVLSQESNAKTCASLVLRLEKEMAAWSLQSQKNSARAHTPSCLLDGWSSTAEIVRSRTQRAALSSTWQNAGSRQSNEESVRFSLGSVVPPKPTSARVISFCEREKERMHNPG
jgi:hypothetical protein